MSKDVPDLTALLSGKTALPPQEVIEVGKSDFEKSQVIVSKDVEVTNEELKRNENSFLIDINLIDPDKDQCRDLGHTRPMSSNQQQKIHELAESMKEQGQIEPIVVTKTEAGRYKIVVGERRYQAAKRIGLKEIKAEISNKSDLEHDIINIAENDEREDLNVIERAAYYQRVFIERHGMSQKEIAEIMRKSVEYISKDLSLLKLPEEILNKIFYGDLSRGHGLVIKTAINKDLGCIESITELASKAADKKWSVSALEKKLKACVAGESKESKVGEGETLPSALSKFATNGIDAQIKKGKNNNGKIVLPFSSEAELQKILDLLS